MAFKCPTGFDEPLLHTMFVDKKLSGVSAVQTLSRLNRICENKEDTCVLDFANTHEDIKEAFQPFYKQTYLGESTDTDRIFELKRNLGEYEIYTKQEIDEFVNAILDKQAENIIHSKLDIMLERYIHKEKDKQLEFYRKAKNYLKNYSFLSQILPFEDIELEKLYILLKKLVSKIIPPNEEDLAKGILDNVDFDSYRVQLNGKKDIVLQGDGELMPSHADGSSRTKEVELEILSNIVKEFNERYGGFDANEKNIESLKTIKDGLIKDENLMASMDEEKQVNKDKFHEILKKQFDKLLKSNFYLYQQFSDNENFREYITQKLYHMMTTEAI